MSDDRPARYEETASDGRVTVVYRASSLGGCERSLVAHARKYAARPHPQWFQDVLDEGTAAEPAIRKMRHAVDNEDRVADGWTDQAELELEVATINGKRVIVRAHADDLMVNGTDAVLREYKKFRDSTWPDFQRRGVEVQPYYPWQVAAMMHALIARGLDVVCEFIGGHFEDGRITEIETKTLVDPPLPLTAILKKVGRIERMVNEGLDPSEVPCQPKYPCGHWYLHDDADATVPEVAAAVGGEAAAQWLAANQFIKQLEAALEATKKRRDLAAESLRQVWPADEKKATFTLPDGTTQTLTRVRSEVPERTQVVKAHTKDYFQLPRSTNRKDTTSWEDS